MWPQRTKKGEGVHETGITNFVLQGAAGRWERGAARTKLARRTSCSRVVLASGQVKVGAGVHEIGTANFVLGGASGRGREGVAWGCSWHVASEKR